MKKLIIAVFIMSIMLNLCACSESVGAVSGSTDPAAYFVSDQSWTLAEIENRFGKFETSTTEGALGFSYTLYSKSNVSTFGESWNFWIQVLEGSDNEVPCGNFTFNQNHISDEAFVSYRDEIIAHYTTLYGNPEQLYASSNMPAWSWKAPAVTVILQDCRAQTGSMNLTFLR